MNNQEIIATAKQAIEIEVEGLNLLKDSLNQEFIKAVNLIASSKGKVIVSGVGKSGHVAKKIAATLASTGTPAFFVHPTEALHGDLGMIDSADCVILISNSGNSIEITGLIDYCLKYGVNLIGITNNTDSTLAKASNVFLQLPKASEACPLNKAPTTSTTITMVLGDCLAIALLKLHNFSENDFKKFHPGGSLGYSLKQLQEIMHTDKEVPLITSGSSTKEALITITSKRFGCVGVINSNKKMIGIITDGDLRRNLNQTDFLNLPVDKIMTTNFCYLSPTSFAAEALALMNKQRITNLFILNTDATPIGIVHIHDLNRIK